jgi:hypothetical protein
MRIGLLAAPIALLLPGGASAIEYPLVYSPPGNYKDLTIAGYNIAGKTVVGNCSYVQITSGSGRDPHTTYTSIPQTCTWNLYGALLSTVSGAPVPPTPVGSNGTETIYARRSAKLFTGSDSALSDGGFVFNYGPHYDWTTSNAYMVLPQQPHTFTVTLVSNGDAPLTVTKVMAKTALRGAKLTIDGTTCVGSIALNDTCDVTVTYDDSKLSSATGLAYDTVTIALVSDAGVKNAFVQRFTDEVRIPPD